MRVCLVCAFFCAILAWGLVVNVCFKNTVRFSASLSKWCFLFYLGKTEKFLLLFVQGQTLWLKYDLGQLPSSTFDQLWKEIPAKSQCPSKTFMVLVSYDFSLFYHRGRDMGVGVGVVNWPLNGLDRPLSTNVRSFVLFLFTVFLSQRWILFVVIVFYHCRHLAFGLLSLVVELSLQLGRASLGPFKLLNA